MDILRIATAGSVDVGKSTLIGRLLFDTGAVTKDKLDAVEASSKKKGLDFIDLSLLTDGLIAERAQNITIDVAHIYFATEKRKYIIADSPGHFEFIRNMITGASNAQAFIVLVDAGIGITDQTKRHLCIAALLNIQTVFVCINKMDIAGFDQSVFEQLQQDVLQLTQQVGYRNELMFIPIAAKNGDNITRSSSSMPWYKGKTLLQYMENIPLHRQDIRLPLRMPVQLAITDPNTGYLSFAGRLISGTIQKGQQVTLLPHQQQATVTNIIHAGNEIELATPGQSISVSFDEAVNLQRGDMIVETEASYQLATNITATICWLDEQRMQLDSNYILQHGTRRVKAQVRKVTGRIDINTMQETAFDEGLQLNDIGKAALQTADPVFPDRYAQDFSNGSFILIHETTNNTVAVGFVDALG